MKYYAGIGARKTPKVTLDEMKVIASNLSKNGYVLRSGAAVGADQAFEKGCKGPKEIYLPWFLFNGYIENDEIFSAPRLENYSEARKIAAEFHPKWTTLSHTAKRYHTRNVYQILGKDLNTPSNLVVCWTEDGKASGGTGQALRIAKSYKIPIINLKIHSFNLNNLSDFTE
jgi:hypothetical protein